MLVFASGSFRLIRSPGIFLSESFFLPVTYNIENLSGNRNVTNSAWVKGSCFFYLNYFFHDPENGFAVDMCKTELFWFSLKSYFLKSCPTWKVRVISVYISWAVIVTVCRFLWGPEVEGTMWLWHTVVKLWFWQQNANLKCDSGITAAAAPFFPSTVKYTEIRCSSFFLPPSPMLSVPLR